MFLTLYLTWLVSCLLLTASLCRVYVCKSFLTLSLTWLVCGLLLIASLCGGYIYCISLTLSLTYLVSGLLLPPSLRGVYIYCICLTHSLTWDSIDSGDMSPCPRLQSPSPVGLVVGVCVPPGTALTAVSCPCVTVYSLPLPSGW